MTTYSFSVVFNHKVIMKLLLALVLSMTMIASVNAEVASFPGAEGFGGKTPGGRGGKVLFVTNLNDSGPGSFRDAVKQSGPRIVIFKTGGTIALKSSVKIDEPYLTIAGQTAPGGGIAFRNDGNTSATIRISTHDVILRHLRIRPGPGGEADGLAIMTANAHDIIIDHCSITWGVDESVSTYTGDASKKIKNLTIQWSLISDALHCSTHGEGCHSKGLLLQYVDRVSIHHNLFANNGGRNPMILSGDIEVSNNVMYNFGGSNVKMENRHGDVNMNFQANYIEPGEDSDMSENGIQVKTDGITLYLKDNFATHVRPNNSYSEDAIVNWRAQGEVTSKRFTFPPLTLTSALQAYEDVLEQSGATVPSRDRVDRNIVQSVQDKNGRLIDHPSDVGGYPYLVSGTPELDSDSDGMPDHWEQQRELNSLDGTDHSDDFDGDGYTNIEEYINELADALKTDTPQVTATPTLIIPKPTATQTPLSTVSQGEGEITVKVRVNRSNDDAEEQVSNSSVDLNSSDLELGEESSAQLVGMKFASLGIPQGAIINNAYVQFTVDETSTSRTNLTIAVEKTINPKSFENTKGNISARNTGTKSILWNDIPRWNNVGDSMREQATPNIASLLQDLVERATWSEESSFVVIIKGEGKRVAESFDGSSSGAPLLVVQYQVSTQHTASPTETPTVVHTFLPTSTPTPTPTFTFSPFPTTIPVPTETQLPTSTPFPTSTPAEIEEDTNKTMYEVVVSLKHEYDDAEERLSNGKVDLTSSDLELGEEGTSAQIVGLRFLDIGIPQGASIEHAYLEFITDEVSTVDTNLVIEVLDSVSPAAFSSFDYDISSRSTVPHYLVWNPGAWNETGEINKSVDVTKLIHTLVSKPEWTISSSAAFVITGQGTRVAESYDKAKGNAARLFVKYSTATLNSPDSSDSFNFSNKNVVSYGRNQDADGLAEASENGSSFSIKGNAWKAVEARIEIQPTTVMEFDYTLLGAGEIQAIGLDSSRAGSAKQSFQLAGTQRWGIQDFKGFIAEGQIQHYKIPIGAYMSGNYTYITVVQDDDVSKSNAEVIISNLHFYEEPLLTTRKASSITKKRKKRCGLPRSKRIKVKKKIKRKCGTYQSEKKQNRCKLRRLKRLNSCTVH